MTYEPISLDKEEAVEAFQTLTQLADPKKTVIPWRQMPQPPNSDSGIKQITLLMSEEITAGLIGSYYPGSIEIHLLGHVDKGGYAKAYLRVSPDKAVANYSDELIDHMHFMDGSYLDYEGKSVIKLLYDTLLNIYQTIEGRQMNQAQKNNELPTISNSMEAADNTN